LSLINSYDGIFEYLGFVNEDDRFVLIEANSIVNQEKNLLDKKDKFENYEYNKLYSSLIRKDFPVINCF